MTARELFRYRSAMVPLVGLFFILHTLIYFLCENAFNNDSGRNIWSIKQLRMTMYMIMYNLFIV